VNTVSRQSSNPEGHIAGRIVLSGACLLIAALMIWLAVPRAMAGLILFNAENTLTSLRLGETVPAAARASLLSQQRSALTWARGGAPSIDYGYAVMAAQARDATEGKTVNAKQTNAIAEKALIAGLSQMPVNAEGWFMLAVVRRASGENDAKAASAIRMSVFTGPHIPVLAAVRLRLMFRLWPQFAKDEKELIYRQVRFAWAVAPDDVVAMAVDAQNDWPIRIALSLQPKELQRFEEKLAAAKKAAAEKSK
jgi:hypothetical protein